MKQFPQFSYPMSSDFQRLFPPAPNLCWRVGFLSGDLTFIDILHIYQPSIVTRARGHGKGWPPTFISYSNHYRYATLTVYEYDQKEKIQCFFLFLLFRNLEHFYCKLIKARQILLKRFCKIEICGLIIS